VITRRSSARSCRVRIFVDYWNLARDWRNSTGRGHFPDRNLDWKLFPQAVLDALDDGFPSLGRSDKELRAVKVYSALRAPADLVELDIDEQARADEERRLQTWFQNELDQFTAYTVDITPQSDRPLPCEVCHTQNSHFVEQGVDTKIAIDLVSLASSDLYDVAVLVTNDTDLIPSVQCVQDSLDKQVVHLGFRDIKTEVRTESWGHLMIDDMFSEILRT
jgi:hypothetical protein